ncbi:hypothetical protein ABPG75_005240 [Micractinium tetrahymenae]
MAGPAAAVAAWPKAFTSAVCLIPPRAIWPRIQECRVFNDKSFTRWPPHVNLLYPFVEARHFPKAAQLCREALAGVQPFEVALRELDWFEHGPRSCTLWVRPEAEELAGVQAALASAFPQCTDLSSDPGRGITAFTPHLSLGQWRGAAAVAAAAAEQRAGAWARPAAFQAGGVALIAREGYEHPFSVRWFVPFGGGQPRQLDVPYIATVGEPCPLLAAAGSAAAVAAAGGVNGGSGGGSSDAPAPARAEFGLGSARPDGSVWVLSYGANMSPTKLSGVRGIAPLESLPAALPGWRLAFVHRGAMGSLVPLAPGERGPAGLGAVHGVLHRLGAADYGRLINMEHEYLPVEVEAVPYGTSSPLPAVALVTPEDKRIADGLPPIQRYLSLLQEGAAHHQLDPGYVAWLNSLQGIDRRERGDAYYTAAGSGEPLPALPKIRTGSQPRQGGGRGRGRRGGGGRRSGDEVPQQRRVQRQQ